MLLYISVILSSSWTRKSWPWRPHGNDNYLRRGRRQVGRTRRSDGSKTFRGSTVPLVKDSELWVRTSETQDWIYQNKKNFSVFNYHVILDQISNEGKHGVNEPPRGRGSNFFFCKIKSIFVTEIFNNKYTNGWLRNYVRKRSSIAPYTLRDPEWDDVSVFGVATPGNLTRTPAPTEPTCHRRLSHCRSLSPDHGQRRLPW